jgi:hypothetical protein
MHFLYTHHIAHRDIKPGSILLLVLLIVVGGVVGGFHH